MSDRRLRVGVALLASAGAGITGYLLYERLTGGTIACSTGGCEQVQDSEYAEVAEVPVALLGLVAYLAILATSLSSLELARAAGAAIALGGLAFSAYLLYVEIALIEPCASGASRATWCSAPWRRSPRCGSRPSAETRNRIRACADVVAAARS